MGKYLEYLMANYLLFSVRPTSVSFAFYKLRSRYDCSWRLSCTFCGLAEHFRGYARSLTDCCRLSPNPDS